MPRTIMPRAAALLAVLAATAGFGGAAQARLLAERVDGIRRICTYERPGVPFRDQVALSVAAGEPCPMEPPPHLRSRPARRPVSAIPAMASFRRELLRDGRRICVYAYAGREYSQASPTGGTCPVSPPRSP